MLHSFAVFLALSNLSQSRPSTPNKPTPRQDSSIPQYVLDHAPLCWLATEEAYFPSDIATHLTHTYPTVNSTSIVDAPSPLTLSNLDSLNAYGNGGVDTYLTSNEGINAAPPPAWFSGTKPDSSGSAPGSAIIIVPKNDSIVDAFYFFFYSYNQGNSVFNDPNLELGDHVGDWEHTMIRFSDGAPTSIYFSQHSSGQAFDYFAVEKDAATNRPVNYVARGTHANWPTTGDHDHTIPGVDLPAGALVDHTSRGTLWDPLSQPLNFIFDVASNGFTSPSGDPTAWINWAGHWGDSQLPDSDPQQKDVFGFRKYVAGPTGPKDKNLGRTQVCEGDPCVVSVLPSLV